MGDRVISDFQSRLYRMASTSTLLATLIFIPVGAHQRAYLQGPGRVQGSRSSCNKRHFAGDLSEGRMKPSAL